MNLYAYAGNNPTTFTDPFGLKECQDRGNCLQGEVGEQGAAHNKALAGLEQDRHGDGTVDDLQFVLTVATLPEGGEGGAIEIAADRMEHVVARHTLGGLKNAGKSIFAEGEDLVALVKNAEPLQAVKQSFGRNYERIVDAGRTIGTDRATGQATSIYTVVTTAANRLWTMFPGRP